MKCNKTQCTEFCRPQSIKTRTAPPEPHHRAKTRWSNQAAPPSSTSTRTEQPSHQAEKSNRPRNKPQTVKDTEKENRPRNTPGGNNYLTNKKGSLKSNQVISIIKDKRGRESR